MAEQTIVWTALPNGTAGGGKTLRISVCASPRLSASTNQERVALSEFPDWLDWPAQDISFSVHLGSLPPIKVVPEPRRRPDLWQKVFQPSTQVQPYSWDEVWIDPSLHRLRSYPAAKLRAFLAGMYSTIGHQSPLTWPSVGTLAKAGLSQIPLASEEYGSFVPGESLEAVLASLERLYDRRAGAIPPGTTTTPAQDIALASVFLSPFPPPRVPLRETKATSHLGYLGPQVPAFEFHQALSLLANHPPLARMFGLVFDLELPRPPGLPATYELYVEPSWKPRIKTADLGPRTMTVGLAFRPLPRQVGPELAGGYFRLGSPGYSAVEVDLDGATLKTLNFASGLRNALARRAADTPTSYALPSLRSAGLSVARSGNAYALGVSLLAANQTNSQLQSSPPPTLYAEDVTRGFRVDVWDSRTSSWHTLSARVASPATGGYLVGNPPTVVPVPPGDEGWSQLGTTSAPQSGQPQSPVGDQNVPETLFRWNGWSLAAPRPGAHLEDNSSGGLSTNEQSSLAPGFPVSISYAATPGTLPVLRFGRRYRFQARAVDLAGNSVGLRPGATPAPLTSTAPVPYLRFEPVASPLLLFRAPRTRGEHLELLVVRSNYDVPDSDPSIAPCERHVVPPPVAEEMAEAHGLIDGPDGRPDPSMYPVLAARASATFNDPSVVAATGGEADPSTLGQFYFPAGQLPVPYLPDPLARGTAFLGLPGTAPSPKPVQVPFFAKSSDWPVARSFRLVLRPGSGPPKLPSGADHWALSVFVPKGIIQAVRVSCYLRPGDLALMGMWSWVSAAPITPKERAALYELATWGDHWMFTPFREVTLVHAVRQPLLAPHFGLLEAQRELGLTYASLGDTHVAVDHKSTARLDVLASWTEPFDDGTNPAGSIELSGHSRVGELDLAYSPTLEKAAFSGMRHDFGDTKHRAVYYEAVATTRFLEYFAKTKDVTLSGAAPAVVSPAGFAAGATRVTGTRVENAVIYKGGKGPTEVVVYHAGADYAEDDVHGTIARLPEGSIPDGATVEVSYVVPPVTRTSLEHPVPPATSRGYRVSIPSSARPLVPDVRYMLPAFGWTAGTDASGNPYSRRSGKVLRIYLGRPWWSSGEGELLGVVMPTHLDVGIEPQLGSLFSRAGADPLWVAGGVGSGLRLGQFPLAVATASGIVLAEQHYDRDGMADIAGHEVSFDPVHGLWFADVLIDLPPSYWPFVRLGLVRYQPSSLVTAEVSPVVQTDFAQLAPDRLATLSFPSPDAVTVTVTGPAVAYTQPLPLSMKAFVEVQRPGVSDPDLQWEPANPDITSGTPLVAQAAGVDLFWQGTVKLPAPRGSQPMRVRVQEAELLPVDTLGTLALELGERVTYLDTLPVS
jgi:hypothetical protein